MKLDLAGKIKNTPLPRSKALWPMLEAVVNSFQAIEDAGERVRKPTIEIVATRDPSLHGIESDTEVNGFSITDNGVGFNDENVDSFFTSDTQYKLRRGGKGLGRFIWLKAFDHAEIESHYPAQGKFLKMAFDFSLDDGDQPPGLPQESQETTPRTNGQGTFELTELFESFIGDRHASDAALIRTEGCEIARGVEFLVEERSTGSVRAQPVLNQSRSPRRYISPRPFCWSINSTACG